MHDSNRIKEVDALRGLAIVMMIIYHLLFDLDYFGIVGIDIKSLPLVIFQRIIGVMFVGLVGLSLILSEKKNKNGYMKHLWRGFKLANFAILITAVTWIYPHTGFITFGVIHMLALSTFLAPIFFRFGKWNFVIGAAIIIFGIWLNMQQTDSTLVFWLGLTCPQYEALDFYPMMPWFGVVLIGMAIGQKVYTNGTSRVELKSKWADRLALLGKNSLAIYLVHQIVLISAIIVYLTVK